MFVYDSISRCARAGISRTGFSCAALAGAAVLTFTLLDGTSRGADASTVDEIAAKLEKQRAAVKSLFVELHAYSTISVPPEVLLSWPQYQNMVALVDQRHEFAFKGPKRYWREEQLKPPQMLRKIKGRLGQPDSCRADNGQISWNRVLDESAKRTRAFNLSIFRSRPDRQWVPTPDYFATIGWMTTDLESKDKFVEAQRANDLIEMLKHHGLRITAESIKSGDANCLQLEGDTERTFDFGGDKQTVKSHHTIWLDLDHGLAVRQHDRRTEKGFSRSVNSDFVEVTPGFWLPKKTAQESFAPASAPKEYQDRAVSVWHSDLTRFEINSVPDDLFDPVTKPGDRVNDQRSMPRE